MLTQPQPPHNDEITEICNSFSLQDQWNSVQSNQCSTVSIAWGRICVVCIYLNFHWRNMRCDVKIQRLWSLVDKRNDVTLFESLSEIDFQRWIMFYKEKNTSFATFKCISVSLPPPISKTVFWQSSTSHSLNLETRKRKIRTVSFIYPEGLKVSKNKIHNFVQKVAF